MNRICAHLLSRLPCAKPRQPRGLLQAQFLQELERLRDDGRAQLRWNSLARALVPCAETGCMHLLCDMHALPTHLNVESASVDSGPAHECRTSASESLGAAESELRTVQKIVGDAPHFLAV